MKRKTHNKHVNLEEKRERMRERRARWIAIGNERKCARHLKGGARTVLERRRRTTTTITRQSSSSSVLKPYELPAADRD